MFVFLFYKYACIIICIIPAKMAINVLRAMREAAAQQRHQVECGEG